MKTFEAWLGVTAIATIVALAAVPAFAAEEAPPLMVAAEIEPGLGIDARDVRAAVGAELHRKVAAPSAASYLDVSDVLLVSLTRARTVISFRARANESAARAIPTPAEHAARLRAVAWLAGNLARDQVSPLVLAAATEAPEPHAPRQDAQDDDGRVAASSAAATAPPSVVAPAPSPSEAEVTEVRASPQAAPPADARWRLTLSGGAATSYSEYRATAGSPGWLDPVWQLEVQHRPVGGWLLGGAIDYDVGRSSSLSYAFTAGVEQRWRGFQLEEVFGLGIATWGRMQSSRVTTSSFNGVTSETTVSPSLTVYGRGFITLAHPVWRSWDVVARVGAFLDLEDTVGGTYAMAAFGVRLRLP